MTIYPAHLNIAAKAIQRLGTITRKQPPGRKTRRTSLASFLASREAKVLYHVFAKDTVERIVGKRQSAAQIDSIVNILITKPININPVNIVNPSRAGTEIQEQRSLGSS